MESNITIGEIVRYYRNMRKMSQANLAEGICERKYISNIELNKQIPTLDMVNQLSDKLGVNLYETYALMLRHRNIETHRMIEKLNQNFGYDRLETLKKLIDECAQNENFREGEPYQHLCYAKALYRSNVYGDSDETITIALRALSIKSAFEIEKHEEGIYYSNIELVLIKLIFVEYCRKNELAEAKKYFGVLYKYIIEFFRQSHYATNRNNHFEIRFISNLVYNYFIFYRDEEGVEIEQIEEALELLKSLHSHYLLPELLFCKAYIQYMKEDVEKAKETYMLAHNLASYLYEENYVAYLERKIMRGALQE